MEGVTVVDPGGFPAEMVSCVKETLGYAPFHAHDQRDGMDFSFPVRFDF